jgi:hypothetical protein
MPPPPPPPSSHATLLRELLVEVNLSPSSSTLCDALVDLEEAIEANMVLVLQGGTSSRSAA